ncbi:MAG: hypothetical protein JO353_08945 [Phycisphaerae bacterium]|nr:hypothetical protein [Phycisphaerae bacterium]
MIQWRGLASIILAMACVCAAQSASATKPVTAISPDQLWAIDSAELGALAKDDDRNKLADAHALIEKFFADPDSRPATIAALTATEIDSNILGRICRIHARWPALAPGVYYLNERVGPNIAVYFLGIPHGYTPTNSVPLVIELPTASGFVGDPKPDADRITQIYTAWITDELNKHPDAAVLMPLVNLTDLYGPTPEGMNHVIAPLQHVTSVINVDPSRVYLYGFAMSSIAAWDLSLHNGTYFAAFDAMAGVVRGDWQRTRLMNLRNTLPVIWQDDSDPVAPVSAAKQIVEALRRLKCDVDYEQTHDLGHVPADQIIADRYAAMRKRTRELYPHHVTIQSDRQEPVYNRLDWIRIDQPLMPGKERRLILENGEGKLTLDGNTRKVDATIDRPNHITIVTDNVANFRVFLNDQIVDFTQSITISVNGRGRFEGMVKPDVREMLMDQLTLGRGWRYFTGHADIDLTTH